MASLKKLLRSKSYIPVKLIPVQILYETEALHFLVKAEINGKKGYFLLDTGASVSVIDKAKTGKFNVKPAEFQPDINGISASGNIDMEISLDNKIRIKNWKRKHIPVVIMDIAHINTTIEESADEIDGIIGADILNEGKAVIDFLNKRLYLKK